MKTENTAHSKTIIDPICGMTVNPESAAGEYEYDGTTYYFCSKGCLNKFTAEKKSPTAPIQISRETKKSFNKIRAYYVGPGAERLLRAGFRLTDAVQSPPSYDLQLLPDADGPLS